MPQNTRQAETGGGSKQL